MITIGLDLGTTGLKGVALHADRGVVAQAVRSNDLHSSAPGTAEASPEQWRTNLLDVLAELVAHPEVSADVAGIATTGMVPAVVLVDGDGAPLGRAMLQNDARARAEVEWLAEQLDPAETLDRTGSPVTQQSVGPTAVWLQRNEPGRWHATERILGSYDWALTALGARPHIERNWAIESGLFRLDLTPYSPAVTASGVGDRLPPVARSGDVVGAISPDVAAAVGLRPGVPLVVGGADHVLSAVGAGLRDPGDWLVKLGGAGDILAVATTPITDQRFYLDEHPVAGRWLPNGCMATSGSLVRWVQRLLGEDDLAALDAGAAERRAADVLCLPYFLGEKSPLNDPELRGVLAGLHLGHDRYDVYRAALEGIAFGFRHNADTLRDRGIPLDTATVTNGGATSLLWKRIHASVLGTPLRTVVGHPGAALGAAVAAQIGVGGLPGWESIGRFVRAGDLIEPDPALVARYDEAYALWRELSDVTAETMRAAARR